MSETSYKRDLSQKCFLIFQSQVVDFRVRRVPWKVSTLRRRYEDDNLSGDRGV